MGIVKILERCDGILTIAIFVLCQTASAIQSSFNQTPHHQPHELAKMEKKELTKREKASLNSETCSSVRESACKNACQFVSATSKVVVAPRNVDRGVDVNQGSARQVVQHTMVYRCKRVMRSDEVNSFERFR
jgi:hypothetical protein